MSSPRYWREIPQRYRLEAGKCTGCGRHYFPPRVVCAECKGREFETVRLSGNGKVVTYTVIHVPATQFSDEAPFAIGIIEMEEGLKITSQIVDCDLDAIEIGQPVRVEFRKIQEEGKAGILCYGYKCVPA